MQEETILIVDDTPGNLDLLGGLLKEKYKIKVANSGEKALEIISSDIPPNLILLDIIMPGMDGYTVCGKLKGSIELREIPVIFVSAGSDIESIVKGFQVGGADYITKPFYAEEVLARINTQMELQRARIELRSLLSNTLLGSVSTMIDLLTLTKPMLMQKSTRMSKYTRKLLKKSALPESEYWNIELAVMLSQIGCISIPEPVLTKKCSGLSLNSDELLYFKHHPDIGADIVLKIPRLENVAEIIRNQLSYQPLNKHRYMDTVSVGSSLLNLLVAYDDWVSFGLEPEEALIKLQEQSKKYFPAMLESLCEVVSEEKATSKRTVKIDELAAGMVLAEDLLNRSEDIFLLKDTELTNNLIELLKQFSALEQCASDNAVIWIK